MNGSIRPVLALLCGGASRDPRRERGMWLGDGEGEGDVVR